MLRRRLHTSQVGMVCTGINPVLEQVPPTHSTIVVT